MKIFIIEAGQEFGFSQGELNKLVSEWTKKHCEEKGFEIKTTSIRNGYNAEEEVSKFTWADVIIYHTPIWWFSVPFEFKRYIDEVLSAGAGQGIFESDGRSSTNPKRNYGKGGSLHGRKYMLTTTWNAPLEAFTIPGEFFDNKSVDDGVMYGFHQMNRFIGLESLKPFHFYDVMKDFKLDEAQQLYSQHLKEVF